MRLEARTHTHATSIDKVFILCANWRPPYVTLKDEVREVGVGMGGTWTGRERA